MRTTILTGLAATAMLAAASGLTPAQAMPAQPSAISQANEATSNVVDVQWRRGYRGRYWGYRGRYWGPRYYGGYYPRYYGGYYPSYGYGYPYYAGPYIGGFGFGIGFRGFRFGFW
jgi:hypothetical protein